MFSQRVPETFYRNMFPWKVLGTLKWKALSILLQIAPERFSQYYFGKFPGKVP